MVGLLPRAVTTSSTSGRVRLARDVLKILLYPLNHGELAAETMWKMRCRPCFSLKTELLRCCVFTCDLERLLAQIDQQQGAASNELVCRASRVCTA